MFGVMRERRDERSTRHFQLAPKCRQRVSVSSGKRDAQPHDARAVG
jgi:hypothetical protein